MSADPDDYKKSRGVDLINQAPISPWSQLKDKPLLIGRIGVDSGTVTFGDIAFDAIKIYTPRGDGCYPAYIRYIDGRRCLVIDFDSRAYGETPYEYNDGERCQHSEWKCPQCQSELLSCSSWDGGSEYYCFKNHRTEIIDKPIVGFDVYRPELDKE